jgi:hypothetical protein
MTPESGRPHLRRTFPAFAESLVDIILAGVQVEAGSAVLVPVDNESVNTAIEGKQPRRGKRN